MYTICHVTKNKWLHCYEEYTICTTNTCMCCELLTWSVTGAEPDQMFICQTVEDLIKIHCAGHQCARASNYRSMRHGSVSAMLKTEESVFRH